MKEIFEIISGRLLSFQYEWDPNTYNSNVKYEKTVNGCILYHVIIPDNVYEIGDKAFANNNKISKITMPSTVREIGNEAFRGCTELEQIEIQNPYIRISNTAFAECCKIQRLSLSNIINFSVNQMFCYYYDSIKSLSEIVSTKKGENNIMRPCKLLKEHYNNLLTMAVYYNSLGMNVTVIRGDMDCSYEDNNKKSFKNPVGGKNGMIRSLYNMNQSLIDIFNINWEECSGLGLALGHSRIRAIDVDGIYYEQDTTIERFLEILGLPKDYQWVVHSGSGNGFHIIFESDDIEDNIDSVAYIPNDDNIDRWEGPLFERLELRWKDHLVLPPSIHYNGNNYSFRNESIPNTHLQHVEIAKISNLVNNYCGFIEFKEFKEGDITCEIVDLAKIYCECSYAFKYDTKVYQEDAISWLAACQTPEAYNSLAIRFLTGNGVEVDKKKAFELFKKAGDYSLAIFNISSLLAFGVFEGTEDDIQLYIYNLLSTCDFGNIEFGEKIDKIFNQIESPKCKNDLYLFFDTETTGLPLDYNASSANVANWPRLVQLSWILMTESKKIVAKDSYVVKPNQFEIPIEASNIHKITTEIAKEQGQDLDFVLEKFLDVFSQATYLVGHNVDFDKKVVGAELIRTSHYDLMGTKFSYCTMKNSINFCKIPYKQGYYKYPKLQELYFCLFGMHFEGEHNAANDVEATQKCFWAMRERGLI